MNIMIANISSSVFTNRMYNRNLNSVYRNGKLTKKQMN